MDRAHGQKHRAILARESQPIFLPGFRTRLRLRDISENPRPRDKADSRLPMSFQPDRSETLTRFAR